MARTEARAEAVESGQARLHPNVERFLAVTAQALRRRAVQASEAEREAS